MKESNKFVSPALFLLVALCFFLPFVSFTCQGQRIATISGMELVTGTRIDKFQMENFNMQQDNTDTDKQREVKSEPLAAAALIFAVIGIIVSFIPRYNKILSIVIGALGVMMLLFLRSSIGGQVTGDFDFKIVEISYEWGYYFALLFFAAGFALNLYLKISENKPVTDSTNDIPVPDAIFCPKCGYSNSAGSIFCSKCGHTLTSEGNL